MSAIFQIECSGIIDHAKQIVKDNKLDHGSSSFVVAL